MDFKKIKREMKKAYFDEYLNKVENESFFKSIYKGLENTAGGALYTAVAVGCVMVGFAFFGQAAIAGVIGKGFLATVGVTMASAVGLIGFGEMGRMVAKRNLNKDIKGGKLLNRYKNEIISQKKKTLRAEASAALKDFNEKKDIRKQKNNALDEIKTLPTEDFKNAFKKVSFKQRIKNSYYKAISVTPLKNKGPKS